MKHCETFVTPQMATEFLSIQKTWPLKQRRINTLQVRRYAEMMRSGKWQKNGESLKFNGSQLLDGQHRLHAVIEADVTLPFLIVNDLEASSFSTIDQGMPRTITHLLEIQNYTYKANVIAAARRTCLYLKDKQVYAHSSGSAIHRIETDVLMEYIIANGEALQEATKIAAKCNIGHTSLLATLCFLRRENPAVGMFFQRLRDGISVHPQDPVHLLREKLLVNRVGAVRRANAVVVMAWCVKSWNAYLMQRQLRRLYWDAERETFPEIL
jgi:hypothetical protein